MKPAAVVAAAAATAISSVTHSIILIYIFLASTYLIACTSATSLSFMLGCGQSGCGGTVCVVYNVSPKDEIDPVFLLLLLY